MLQFSMFKRQKPRQYNHKNIYYNPEQEAREARRRMALGDKYKDEYVPGDFIRDVQYRRQMRMRQRSVKQRTTLWRMIIFLGLLVLVLWYFGS